MKIFWYILSFIACAASYFPFSIGWRKLNYSGSKLHDAYVGGDAYNFIINSEQATAYCVLGGILILCGMAFMIAGYLCELNNASYLSEWQKNLLEKQRDQNKRIIYLLEQVAGEEHQSEESLAEKEEQTKQSPIEPAMMQCPQCDMEINRLATVCPKCKTKFKDGEQVLS